MGRNKVLTWLGVGILTIAACIALGKGLFFAGPPLFGFALLGLLGVALWRAAENRGDDSNRVLRRAGLGILLIVVSGVGFVAVGVGAAVGGGAVIAGLVIAIGVALVIASFVGGARWLVLPALVIAIPLGFVAAAGIDTDGGIGDRDYRPTSLGRAARRLRARHRRAARRPARRRPARRPHAARAQHGHRQRPRARPRGRLRGLRRARRRRLRPRVRLRQRGPRRRLAPEPEREARRQAARDRREHRRRRAPGRPQRGRVRQRRPRAGRSAFNNGFGTDSFGTDNALDRNAGCMEVA